MTDVYGTQENQVSESSRNDLTKIKGIGATTAERLYNTKIITVKQIAEMTPEILSETPGVGLTTALKFITAAKDYLKSSQKEDSISEKNQIQDILKVESESNIIEKFEVAEVVVEEIEEINEESPKEVNVDLVRSQSNQKWFSNKFNYSRLTASYPPVSEQAEIVNDKVEEEQTVIEHDEQDTQGTTAGPQEDSTQVIIPEIRTRRVQPELKNDIEEEVIDYTPEEPNKIDLEDSSENLFEDNSHQQISDTFKGAGCYEIPASLDSLKLFTTSLDYLGCKVVKVSDDLRILFLFPVKRFDREGTVLVDEDKLELKSNSSKKDLGAYYNIEHIAQNLLHVRDSLYEDIASKQNILTFFQKYLQINLSLEKGFGNKSVVFLSGSTQYKVLIEPILLCYNPPNLHAVTRADLAPLVKFLEKKYQMIEKRTKKTNSIKNYRQAGETLSTSVRYASIPIFGYSVTLLVIYFAGLYFLLRLFNTIGFAVVGIYISLVAFFYFRAHKTKKEFTVQFETPYYLQNLEFSEIDLLDFKVELTDELLTQFGYECLEKDVKFGVIEQSETNALKKTVEIKRAEPELKKMFEPELVEAETISKMPIKYETKYQNFLEDS
ncbi:MAG: helix-hairpin-helix domain-containing protein [Promethearchaeota archaeon]